MPLVARSRIGAGQPGLVVALGAAAYGGIEQINYEREKAGRAADNATADQAALMLRQGKSIEYVMTTAGPEPLDNIQHPLDREHYVDKQVRPVAEPVLDALRLDFERVIGDARQADLF